MASACGVSWDGVADGKLDESAIPDAPNHKSHYLNAAETKGDSSFPVVDGDGRLRAGNVNAAWDLRTRGDGVSEECLRELDNAFDGNVLPDSAYENMTVTIGDNDVEGKFGMNLSFTSLPTDVLGEDFNEYGVRENDDGSLDVRFQAMEPGIRKGVEITPEFLEDVSSRDYGRIPIQLDHSDSQRANVGYTKPGNIEFNGDFLTTQIHIPNTGSSVRDDIIADFTHTPPQVQDISVAFDPKTMEVEKPRERGENPKFTSGRIREFSLTPFPAGYDNGGLTPEFSAAVEQAVIGPDETEEPESQLITRPHTLIRNYD
jgi:hypothetical protein